ncbi:MAG: class I SAM-dependent methyltransferase [Chloroflexota bacterium]
MSDALSPGVADLLDAWRARVLADLAQVDARREVADPADFYAPVKDRFRMDPRRTDDATLNSLVALVQPDDVWLDVGAGGGRYALPLALRVRQVVTIDPSASMLGALREDAAANGISNVETIDGRWPMADPPAGDVALMAHVGYDIEQIGQFVDQLESQASRLCVAVMGESSMQTSATLFWEQIHGEPRVRLPALPEFLTLLTARGRLAEITLTDRVPPSFATLDEAHAMARRQLWLKEGSAKDQKLRRLVLETAMERDGRYAFDWSPTKIGIVSWHPR